MIKLKSLKLNQIGKSELESREMAQLMGGTNACGCGCYGSSSTYTNASANWTAGYSQSYGGEKLCGYHGQLEWDSHF